MGLKPPGSGLIARPVGRPPPSQPPPGQGSGQRRPTGQVKPVGQVRPAGSAGSMQSNGPDPRRTTPQPKQAPQTSQETPNLEVGDHVLVSGVKPGVIAFIGPTQFARGVWAGVVLDTNEGKNSGSVNGVAYFECKPNHGLFARPEKLKLVTKASDVNATPARPKPQSAHSRPAPVQQQGDAPQFAVGDRVLVDGVKPGVIAFYGSTEFARGIWAGVVLDAPEGKNQGSVAGVQYFECEANRGLFTRPQKLTLVKGSDALKVQPQSQAQPSQENTLRAPSQPRSAQSTPIDPEHLKALREKLKIGDRVLVGGAKEGILRYLGPTEFSKGIWAGVELEEPLGKNDGAVSGKR